MSQETQSTSTTVTLDTTFNALKHWREHKEEYEGSGIPDKLWKMFFQLEKNGLSGSDIRRVFSINSQQYTKKRAELMPDHHVKTAAAFPKKQSDDLVKTDIKFCKVNVKPGIDQSIPSLTQTSKTSKKTLSQLRSTDSSPEHYLDLTTIIVECIRADGRRLNIHTTTQSLDQVMQAFFTQG